MSEREREGKDEGKYLHVHCIAKISFLNQESFRTLIIMVSLFLF